ncbi:hypothetical protein D3OALGA1CA_3445 [Olavius algarvensis associated proteobacterium Delta 3]|nr:hypothetical protein D3OALGA1CA_3445 [Olavius algarvensis associated proteobacterium Delta 3]CAB5162512.1 hypothetical protein D3OALGB2SA_5519 [Olavius algarvensis associated proteobacterium Delta 3]
MVPANRGGFMKKAVLLMVAVMMTWCGAAFGMNPNDCPGWFGPQWHCNGRVELSDMGGFDDYDNFLADGDLWADIMAWDSGNVIAPFKQFDIENGWMQIRSYATPRPGEQNLTRISTKAGKQTFAPVLWSVTCIYDGVTGEGDPNECPPGQEAFFMDADENAKSRMEEVDFEPVDPSVVQVRWVEKDLAVDYYERPYDGLFPKYKLYPINFWDWNRNWSPGTDYNADFGYVLPDSPGLQHFEFIINGVVEKTLVYNVTTLDPMPTVAATKETDDGLRMTIRAKEIKSGLKITWNDPKFKDIQRPYIQLRVYVGNAHSNGLANQYERFFWIDCPAQIHKLLIPKDKWQELKDSLIADGFTEAQIVIVYRTLDNDYWNHLDYPDLFPFNPEWGLFMNRGHSDPIKIPLN